MKRLVHKEKRPPPVRQGAADKTMRIAVFNQKGESARRRPLLILGAAARRGAACLADRPRPQGHLTNIHGQALAEAASQHLRVLPGDPQPSGH